MSEITIIGDVHHKYNKLKNIIQENEYYVQVGDMGFDYRGLRNINSNTSKFFPGNHDNFDTLLENPPPHYLGRYGIYELNGVEFFYIGGGYSIDEAFRRQDRIHTNRKTWWHQEQLTFAEMEDCKRLFLENRPKLVLTHSPCRSIISQITTPDLIKKFGFDDDFYCQTSLFLDHLFSLHQPLTWISGHMHKSYEIQKGNTLFKGLAELETCIVNNKGGIG